MDPIEKWRAALDDAVMRADWRAVDDVRHAMADHAGTRTLIDRLTSMRSALQPVPDLIYPPADLNAPVLELHGPICECTPCRSRTPKPVDVIPFAVTHPSSRAEGEPSAVLSYGGVRVILGLTIIRTVGSALRIHAAGSSVGNSLYVIARSVDEIERRMWRTIDEEKKRKGTQ